MYLIFQFLNQMLWNVHAIFGYLVNLTIMLTLRLTFAPRSMWCGRWYLALSVGR